tara:strand:- start:13126 stop:13539 length:414 start_codon:yes stop_codon:yes gene_type:complete
MNDQISWDRSLVNKYSSSNHFKLLNQLRNEIKKYPLIKKKNNSPNQISEQYHENNNISTKSSSQEPSYSKNSNLNIENQTTKSTISFNNSKNFSIYKNHNKDTDEQQQENNIIADKKVSEDNSSTTFKDRLTQIDMK